MEVAFLSGETDQSGFSLTELLTTLVVFTAVAAAGLPGLQKLLADQQMTVSVNAMVSALHLARSEAVKRGVRAVLCPSENGTGCGHGAEWQRGFILFADHNGNRRRDSGEPLLRRFWPQEHSPRIRILTTRGRRWIRYQATGEAPGSNLTMTFCDLHHLAAPKAVILSNTGRPRVSASRPNGGALRCR